MYKFKFGDNVKVIKYWQQCTVTDKKTGKIYAGEEYYVGRTAVVKQVRTTKDNTPYATGINYDVVTIVFDDNGETKDITEWMIEKI